METRKHPGELGVNDQLFLVEKLSAPYPSMSRVLKLPSSVGNTATTVPAYGRPLLLSTFSPIADFAIENSFWNHRCDYISTNQLTLLNYVSKIGIPKFRPTAVVIMFQCLRFPDAVPPEHPALRSH